MKSSKPIRIAFLAAALFGARCVTGTPAARPGSPAAHSSEPTASAGRPSLTHLEAKKQLQKAFGEAFAIVGSILSAPTRVDFQTFLVDGFTYSVNGTTTTVLYREIDGIHTERVAGGWQFLRYSTNGTSVGKYRAVFWYKVDEKLAISSAAALSALKYYYMEEASTSTSLSPQFKALAAMARAPGALVPAADAMDRYNFQAAAAVKEGNLEDAIAILARGLEEVPTAAAGHFDIAVLLGETERYNSAILHMKMYLELSPGAADAREAQGRIFGWERKAEVFQSAATTPTAAVKGRAP